MSSLERGRKAAEEFLKGNVVVVATLADFHNATCFLKQEAPRGLTLTYGRRSAYPADVMYGPPLLVICDVSVPENLAGFMWDSCDFVFVGAAPLPEQAALVFNAYCERGRQEIIS